MRAISRPLSSSHADTALRGLYASTLRGAQGVVLLIAVATFGAGTAADVALGLAGVGTVNLLTNVGLPTLLVRYQAEAAGDDLGEQAGHVVTWYLLLTALGAVVLLAVALAAMTSPSVALASTALFIAASASSGLEYWALAIDRHRMFLLGAGAVQGLGSLAVPVVALVTRRAGVTVAMMAAALLAGLLTPSARRLARSALPHGVRRGPSMPPVHVVRAALPVGSATIAFALLYGADAWLLLLGGERSEVGPYRFGISVVGFAVGALPVSMAALAGAARGRPVGGRALALYAVACAALVAAGALLLRTVPLREAPATGLLLAFAPLAAVRLVTQACAAAAHGRGAHRAVARSAWRAVLAVLVLGGAASAVAGAPALLAVQVVVELLLAAALLASARRARPA